MNASRSEGMGSAIETPRFRETLLSIERLAPAERMPALTRLAQSDLSFLQTLQLAKHASSLELPVPAIRVAILSSCTVTHLEAGLIVGALRHGLSLDVWTGEYGQYRHEVYGTGTELDEFRPETIVFSLDTEHVCSDIPVTASREEADAAIRDRIADLIGIWTHAKQRYRASIVNQSFLDTTDYLFGNHDRMIAGSPYRLLQKLNEELAEAASANEVGIVDVARQASRDGLDRWFDRSRWLQGKMQIAPFAALAYGDLLARHIAAAKGLARKCLVVDLDNTLWGGVIGDDGIGGIAIGEGSPVGEAHLRLQRYIKQLKARGIVLAVCSKNELETAEQVFREHPDMLLRRDDFAVFLANWNDKAANIRAIANQLNLGLSSIVFLDDNPAERARVREALPMVAVPELPEDPARYVGCLEGQGYFEALKFTKEDTERADQYAANERRAELQSASTSMDDYLKSLEMKMVYGPIRPVDVERSAQLIGKTNQFNTTTIRYSLDRVREFSTAAAALTLQCRLEDRFGDNGLVSVMILEGENPQSETMSIRSWVMSCRVFGRGLEQEMMNAVVEEAKARGVRHLIGEFVPTDRNMVIESLFADLGFIRSEVDGADPTGRQDWQLSLDTYTPKFTHIQRISAK
jgi:FkbH-like protein